MNDNDKDKDKDKIQKTIQGTPRLLDKKWTNELFLTVCGNFKYQKNSNCVKLVI